MKAIDMKELRIRCDGDECNFEKTITIEEAAEYVDAPCPNCGKSPLMTHDDYSMLMEMEEMINAINDMIGDVDEDEAEYSTIAVASDGKGGISVTDEDDKPTYH